MGEEFIKMGLSVVLIAPDTCFYVSVNMLMLCTCLEDAIQQHCILRKHGQNLNMTINLSCYNAL